MMKCFDDQLEYICIERLKLPVETVRACETLYPQFCVETILDESWETAEAHLRERSPLEILCIYLLTIPELRRRYEKKGIPEDILWNGLRDISIWAAEYEQRYQRPGIAEWRWVAKTLRMEVFRLGRLQFEPTYLQQELRYDGVTVPSGTSALNVHIPAGEPLTENAACESLGRAKAFFRNYLDFDAQIMCCDSWLLSPALQDLLPQESNILRFQKMFNIYATRKNRQAEERVFGCVKENPAEYPQNTLLQWKMKEYLQAGKHIDAGLGVVKSGL